MDFDHPIIIGKSEFVDSFIWNQGLATRMTTLPVYVKDPANFKE